MVNLYRIWIYHVETQNQAPMHLGLKPPNTNHPPEARPISWKWRHCHWPIAHTLLLLSWCTLTSLHHKTPKIIRTSHTHTHHCSHRSKSKLKFQMHSRSMVAPSPPAKHNWPNNLKYHKQKPWLFEREFRFLVALGSWLIDGSA